MQSPKALRLEEFIKEGKYRIPPYQRNFVWKKGTQVEEFWEDFVETYNEKKADPTGDAKLYLGTLILMKVDNDSEFKDIIDGQQRITTIIIFMIALRKYILEHENNNPHLSEICNELYKKIGFYNSNTGTFEGTRLQASDKIQYTFSYMSDRNWNYEFKDEDEEGRGIKRQKNLLKPIFDYFYDQISSIPIEDLEHVMSTLHNIEFIKIEVDSVPQAYELFERVNARGADLDVSDLLKNQLFANIDDANRDIVEEWDEITENSNNNLIRMLKYFYVSRRGYITRSKLYKELKAYAQNDYQKLMIELIDFSEFYKNYHNYSTFDDELVVGVAGGGDWSSTNASMRLFQICQSLNGLHLIGVTQVIPLIYSIVHSFYAAQLERDERHKDTLALVFRNFENYHFINNFVCNRVGNEVEKLYAQFAPEFFNISTDTEFSMKLDQLNEKLKTNLAKREEFIERFKDIEYVQGSSRHILYIFDRLNTKIKPNAVKQNPSNAPKIFFKKRKDRASQHNIEHWLPQRPSNPQDNENMSLHSIGNLLVLPHDLNNQLSNKSPNEKYEFLINNPHENTLLHNKKFIDTYDTDHDWDESSIVKRSEQLGADSYDTFWKFDPKKYS
jgi:uncharacterized protein with ParB-like and HNH nuclease domain